MSTWQTNFERRDWNAVDNVWREHIGDTLWMQTAGAALMDALRNAVPMVTVENGVESLTRHAQPAEVPDELKGAAKILLMGELEAAIENDPPEDSQTWSEIRATVEDEARRMKTADDVTGGAGDLSMRQHAKDALSFLGEVDWQHALAWNAMADGEDRHWLDELCAGIAQNAFMAGRHFEAATKKPIESSAVRGEKVASGARNSAHATNEKYIQMREKRLARMRELVASGLNISSAVAQCEADGLGNAEAIRSQWYRQKRRLNRRPKKNAGNVSLADAIGENRATPVRKSPSL